MNEVLQTIQQLNIESVNERLIIQYSNEQTQDQKIIDYNSLTDEEKAIFDSFKTMCNTLANN